MILPHLTLCLRKLCLSYLKAMQLAITIMGACMMYHIKPRKHLRCFSVHAYKILCLSFCAWIRFLLILFLVVDLVILPYIVCLYVHIHILETVLALCLKFSMASDRILTIYDSHLKVWHVISIVWPYNKYVECFWIYALYICNILILCSLEF